MNAMKVIALLLTGGIFMGCDEVSAAKAMTPDQQAEVKAIGLIAKFEGFRSSWYSCSAGIRTIGYGFTSSVLTDDEKKLVSMDRRTSDRILGREVRKIQKEVRALVTRKLTVDQEVALISFVYNLGLPRFKSSTLLKRINDGSNNAVISAEFNRWVYGGGKVITGLKNRRKTEVKYWCT